MKHYVVSDPHGFYMPMIYALTEKGFFADSEPHKLIILGDLMDRGKQAIKMQEFVCDLMDKDEAILIRGNHEDLYEAFVTEDHGKAYDHHVKNGTYDTALQLTGFDPAMSLIRPFDFAEAAQNTPFYQKIMPAMRDYFETEHYIFVHGWIPCIKEHPTFIQQNGKTRRVNHYSYTGDWRNADPEWWCDARWINGMEAFHTVYENGKTIVCGHWHASYGHSTLENKGSEFGATADFTPFYGSGIIALDACTSRSRFVNCIAIEE